MCRVEPVQQIQRTKQYSQRKPTTEFQNILNKELNIDNDQVYDTTTNGIIEDIDNLSDETVKNLLREE